jgi:hypothetical protein
MTLPLHNVTVDKSPLHQLRPQPSTPGSMSAMAIFQQLRSAHNSELLPQLEAPEPYRYNLAPWMGATGERVDVMGHEIVEIDKLNQKPGPDLTAAAARPPKE